MSLCKAQKGLECYKAKYEKSKTNSQGDRLLQHLPSLQKSQQGRGAQRLPVGLEVHRLLSLPWVRLYQQGQRVQQLQGYPTTCQEDDLVTNNTFQFHAQAASWVYL